MQRTALGTTAVANERETPFDSIESAQQFVELLVEAVEEARREVESEMANPQPERRLEARRLVSYKLATLSNRLNSSARILNDLRMLRRLLFRERTLEEEPAEH